MFLDLTTTYRGCLSDFNTTGIEACSNSTFSEFCITGESNDQDGIDESFGCVQCTNTDHCYNKTTPTNCEPLLLGTKGVKII